MSRPRRDWLCHAGTRFLAVAFLCALTAQCRTYLGSTYERTGNYAYRNSEAIGLPAVQASISADRSTARIVVVFETEIAEERFDHVRETRKYATYNVAIDLLVETLLFPIAWIGALLDSDRYDSWTDFVIYDVLAALTPGIVSAWWVDIDQEALALVESPSTEPPPVYYTSRQRRAWYSEEREVFVETGEVRVYNKRSPIEGVTAIIEIQSSNVRRTYTETTDAAGLVNIRLPGAAADEPIQVRVEVPEYDLVREFSFE